MTLKQSAIGLVTALVFSTSATAQSGLASYYGGGEKLNRHTSNGEVFRPHGLTCAHRSLPIGTRLLVRYKGRQVVCRINDRGPASWTGRSLDLSFGSARLLGTVGQGVANVEFTVLPTYHRLFAGY